jgi:[acyl-carrier-protein] S-malonyltransferase
MSKKWAFIFPGQGAQYPGMAKDFYEQFSIAKEVFEEADSVLGTPFSQLIFDGPAPELTLTKNSQVGIYIASIAILRTVQQNFPDLQPVVSAGLSLGEYTALTAAGKISFQDCLKLVRSRALYMHEACEQNKGGMQVILGLEAELVEEVVRELGAGSNVWVANLNCPGQVVIAGTQEGMELAVAALKAKGAKRALALDVSGAFHSGLMRVAQEKLAAEIRSTYLAESPIQLVMNVPGDYVSDLDAMRGFLIDQVASPVRWEKGVRAMMSQEIEGYIEMGPGKTLAGMNKRIGVLQPTLSIEKVSDLDELPKWMETLCNC